MTFTHDDIPSQSGRTILITGASSGLVSMAVQFGDLDDRISAELMGCQAQNTHVVENGFRVSLLDWLTLLQ